MTDVIVIGHGGYGTAMKNNLGMLVGELEGFHYIDFNPEDSLDILRGRIDDVLAGIDGEREILFACDVAGGSPFRTAAMLCTEHPGWAVAAGLNTSAYSEVSFNLELSALELAEMACDVARETILMFPAKE